jgi:hypothetical protein
LPQLRDLFRHFLRASDKMPLALLQRLAVQAYCLLRCA